MRAVRGRRARLRAKALGRRRLLGRIGCGRRWMCVRSHRSHRPMSRSSFCGQHHSPVQSARTHTALHPAPPPPHRQSGCATSHARIVHISAHYTSAAAAERIKEAAARVTQSIAPSADSAERKLIDETDWTVVPHDEPPHSHSRLAELILPRHHHAGTRLVQSLT